MGRLEQKSAKILSKLPRNAWLDEALQKADVMERQGIFVPRDVAYDCLQECTRVKDMEAARRVQCLMSRNGLDSVGVLGDHLIRLFSFSGEFHEANVAFEKVAKPSLYTWSAIICANSRFGYGERALELYQKMQLSDISSDPSVFIAIVTSCCRTGILTQGRLVHNELKNHDLVSDVIIGNTLIDMYAKCGSLEEARKLFDELENRDTVSFSALVGGYAQHGYAFEALGLFDLMQLEGIKPERATFLAILKACTNTGATEKGRLIHSHIIKGNLEMELSLGNTLIDMYAKCGSMGEACNVFDRIQGRDVVSWDALLAGYARDGDGELSLRLFEQMQLEGVQPDKVTFLSLLKACATIASLEQGRKIHNQLNKSGLEWDNVIDNTIIDMYAKCGALEEAQKIFDELGNRDIVSWVAMISGYAQHGHAFAALDLFKTMQQRGIMPNRVAFLSILKTCGNAGAIDKGRLIHHQIVESGLELDIVLGSAVVDMYVKCGSLGEALKIFDELPNRNIVSWGAMVAAYAQDGHISLAGKFLGDMQKEGIKPDETIYTTLLAACSRAGIVEEGCRYFKSMNDSHNITPNLNHCNCMIDLFSRAGYLKEAEKLLQAVQSNVFGWTCLLTACRTYGNIELGRRCLNQIISLDPYDAGAYILMSQAYSDAHMWEDAERIEEMRKHAGLWKKPAKAWIEVNNELHEFFVGDKDHPQSDKIYAMLKQLNKKLKEEGYAPHFDMVLGQMSDMDKEDALCGHCEKLAIAYGLLSTPEGTVIRATKNLRVCMDCHDATKFISKIEKREIIIRDGYRIHHFKEGKCSCGDYY